MEIDDTDRAILWLLQQDARMPNAEIGRRIGLGTSAIFERMRRLEEAGVVMRHECVLDPRVLGPGLLVAAPGTGKSIVLDTLCTSVTTGDVRVIATALSSCGPFGLVGQLAARYGHPAAPHHGPDRRRPARRARPLGEARDPGPR